MIWIFLDYIKKSPFASKEELTKTKIKYFKKFDHKITEQDKNLLKMCWLPNMYKKPIDERLIFPSKHCSTKPLSNVICKVSKSILTTLRFFIQKVYLMHALKSFGL